MLAIIWLFMTSMFLMTLGGAYAQAGVNDVWALIIAWGFGTLIVAILIAVSEEFPEWWK